MAVQDFEGKNVTPEMYLSIRKAVNDDNCNIDLIYGSLYMILKSALRSSESSLKQEVIFEAVCLCKIFKMKQIFNLDLDPLHKLHSTLSKYGKSFLLCPVYGKVD